MWGILLGATSFFVVFWVDVAALKKIRFVKPALWLVSVALFVWGAALCIRDPERIPVCPAVRAAGWILGVAFALLLLYSLFIEVPFLEAYVHPGQPGAVVARGTYALCRHPGVWWFAGLLVSVSLADGSRWLLLATPVWVVLDALYVVAQDRVFFPRMFGPEYEAYRRDVPFLLPTARSFRRCTQTVFRAPPDREGKE